MVIILFVLSLVFLKMTLYKDLDVNTVLILTSILIMLLVIGNITEKSSTKEHYNESAQIKFLNDLLAQKATVTTNTKVQQATNAYTEDISPISNSLQMYVSTFSGSSYGGYGSTWLDIAKTNGSVQCTPQGQIATRDVKLPDNIVYSTEKGIFLGKTSLTGPASVGMGVSENSEFTIFVLCRHGTINTDNVNIFKMYANTTSNVGLSLDITNIQAAPVQTGTLSVSYANQEYPSTNVVHLDKNVLQLYIITKTHSSISIQATSAVDSTLTTLLQVDLQANNVLFSNKNMCINCSNNWNAHIKAFGVYNAALNNTDINTLRNYLFTEEKKQETLYQQMQQNQTSLTNVISTLKSCQFDAATCGQCADIKDWSNISNVLNATATCKSSIDSYCTAHPTDKACMCWDTTSKNFATNTCQNWRNIFRDTLELPKDYKLDKGTLNSIMDKYGLVDKNTCPASGGGSAGSGDDAGGADDAAAADAVAGADAAGDAADVDDNPIKITTQPTWPGFIGWLTSWF